MLEAVWEEPKKGIEILDSTAAKNHSVYEFEKMLETKNPISEELHED